MSVEKKPALSTTCWEGVKVLDEEIERTVDALTSLLER